MASRTVFRFKLDVIDWHLTEPTDLDPPLAKVATCIADHDRYAMSATAQPQPPLVPVLRIWGKRENGEQVLAHVHGVLPYLYIDYPGPYHAPESEGNQYQFLSLHT